MNLEDAKQRLGVYFADKKGNKDTSKYKGIRKEGAWLLTWDRDAAGDAPYGAPSYLVLDEDGSVHAIPYKEQIDDALARIRPAT